jgi:hypothetical protein
MMLPYSIHFKEVLTQALQLPPAERLAIIEQLAASFRTSIPSSADPEAWTAQEIADLMQVEPLPPAEVAGQGLIGTWADLGITDGAEWVNEQKQLRSERHKW